MIAKGSVARGLSVLLVLALVLAVMPPRAAHAVAVLYATPAASGEGDCYSWKNACTLQTALTSAVGWEIWVAAGTHTPVTEKDDRRATFLLKDGVAVYGGFPSAGGDWSQRDPAVNVTILSGDIGAPEDSIDNSYHVVTGATGAILDGVTIAAGNANGASPDDRGGGMYNSSSSPQLTNVTFISNTATTGGGGMYNSSSSPALTNVTFLGNSAQYGGGMYNENSSSPTLTDVTFISNTVTSRGGGMYSYSSSPTLTNLTFSGNSASEGGGMYNDDSGPTLTNVTFTNNSAAVYGGGMYNGLSDSTLTDVTFTNNSAAGDGGGMYNGLSSPTLTNVTFTNNSAGRGGGMINLDRSPTLTDVTFISNTANYGGGMYNDTSSPPLTNVTFISNTATTGGGGLSNNASSPLLTNVTFSGNHSDLYAGGMYNENSSSPALTDVTFISNTATTGGGGLSNNASSPLLTNVTFSGNHSDLYAGGMYNENSSSPALTDVTFISNTATNQGGGMYNNSGSAALTNVTFSGNSAVYGGGMYNYSGSPALTNATFSGNSADHGGGIYNFYSSPAIRNTIFWGNTAEIGGAQIFNASSTPILSDSVVEGGYITGTNIITTTPMLGALGDYGGSTQTIPLLAGSSAIDGTSSNCPASDQRGVLRSIPTCDIGAYEVQTIVLAIPGGQTSGLCQSWADACELRFALTTAVAGREIWVAAGTYKPTADTNRAATFQLKDGVALYGGFTMTETLRAQRNPTANATILSGDIGTPGDSSDNSYHVVIGATGATLDGFTITAGNADGLCFGDCMGGGMFNVNGSSPTLTNVTFSGNSAQRGGGMGNLNSSTPALSNVSFISNSATYGGGICNQNDSSPSLANVTFSGNAAGNGGGIYNLNSSNPTLTSLTLSSNSAQYGGGIYNVNTSSPSIRNTIFWGNTANAGAQIWDSDSAPSVSDSVVQDGYAGTNIITDDPKLGALGNHGGWTLTIPLQAGSSAINGTSSNCPAADQRGVPRSHPTCDIGAYEFVPVLLAVPGGQTGGLCQSWADACELRFALTSAVAGQEIWAAAGTFKPATVDPDSRKATFQLKNGVALYGGFAMTETARAQRNPAANVTILSGDIGVAGGNSDNSYHVVRGATGATLDGFTITAGNASGGPPDYYGGGIYNVNSNPALANLTITGNTAQYGGGMSNLSSSPTLTNVTFSGNSVWGDGGGMRNYLSSPMLTNVTFSGNSASYAGGGVYNGKSSPILTNVTFSGNSAQYGGGIHNWDSSSPSIRNTIFWGNSATIAGAQIDNANNSSPSVSDSVVQGGYAGGANIIVADPLLGTLGNYGGGTQTIPLLVGSSAIDATSSNCPAADQRGVPRSQPTCDIGAYEVQSIVFLPLVMRF